MKRRTPRNKARSTKVGSLRVNSPEWHRAWTLLAETTNDLDRCAEHPDSHETWQYMGSLRREGERVWTHEFRHREHPSTGQQWVVMVPAAPEWRPGDLFELSRIA